MFPLSLCRQTGQATADELCSRDLRHELEEKERDSRERKDREKTRSFTGEVCGVEREVEGRRYSSLNAHMCGVYVWCRTSNMVKASVLVSLLHCRVS